MLFKKKKKILPSSNIIKMSDEEKHFFTVFYNNLPTNVNKLIKLSRMSDGTISVEYNTYPVGKIKLYGKKHYMQIIKSLYKFETIYEDFESHIDEWIKYIYKHLLREK